jgi:serine/threonine-protein kinase
MKQDFLQSLYPKRSNKPPASVRQPAPNQQQKKTRVQVKKKSKVSGWLETVMIIAALCIIYSFYVYHYLM